MNLHTEHLPVLLNEVCEYLSIQPDDIVIDGTLGLAGHALEFLKRITGTGKLIGFERDPFSLKKAHHILGQFPLYSQTVLLRHGTFSNMLTDLPLMEIKQVNKIFLDLGLSSLHLDTPERGFSFRWEAPLDMRFNPEEDTLTARDIINDYSEEQLADIFYRYGEIRYARRLARAIVLERQKKPIESTLELARLVQSLRARSQYRKKIHPATQVFQALRIEVNQELEHLQRFLDTFPELLSPEGRLAIISYHSLEDRLVKNALRTHERNQLGAPITKKPIRPSLQERSQNPRSRSAKLRVWKKFGLSTNP